LVHRTRGRATADAPFLSRKSTWAALFADPSTSRGPARIGAALQGNETVPALDRWPRSPSGFRPGRSVGRWARAPSAALRGRWVGAPDYRAPYLAEGRPAIRQLPLPFPGPIQTHFLTHRPNLPSTPRGLSVVYALVAYAPGRGGWPSGQLESGPGQGSGGAGNGPTERGAVGARRARPASTGERGPA